MDERARRGYADATRVRVVPEFTAKVFAAIGVDRYTRAGSRLGDVFVAWNASGVCAVRVGADEHDFERWYGERFGRRCVGAIEDDATSRAARARLVGEEVEVPLDLRACSPFERGVLERAAQIRPGQARPYALIASELGQPRAMRAVGNALGRNPVPLLIPCHRVVRADFTPGGYVFGEEAKRKLLEAEGINLEAAQDIARHGIRYIGSPGGWFCLPSCGDIATRCHDGRHVPLRTLDEARAHGLKPCGLCRPVAA